tara:strand:- start:572 stop:1138 length:567 start_codon:yes stop_codon:yes gene_type:complete
MKNGTFYLFGIAILYSLNGFSQTRPQVNPAPNLIFTSMLKYAAPLDKIKLEKTIVHLKPLLVLFKEKNNVDYETSLNTAIKGGNVDSVKMVIYKTIKADILDILNRIANGEINCNENTLLNVAQKDYLLLSEFVVKDETGIKHDVKIKKKFRTILKIHTKEHGGKKHRHCTKDKAIGISELIETISSL